MFLSSVILALHNNDVFKTKTYFTFKVFAASGLRKRPPVYLKGIEVGRVSDFTLKVDGQIEVEFFLMNNYIKFIDGDKFLYLNRNPLTGAIVDVSLIDGGNEKVEIKNNHVFLTSESAEFSSELMSNIHAGEQNAVNTLVSSVERLLSKIENNHLINLSSTVQGLIN